MSAKERLKVFITIDTEVWEFYDEINDNINSGLWGITDSGEYGLKFQLEKFKQYDLKATFFLEPFFSYHSDKTHVFEAIEHINNSNQEVGLHIHTEWLKGIDNPDLKLETVFDNLGEFNLAEQSAILKTGLDILFEGGSKDICCFRAGNYGADNNTLEALKTLGIKYDTSYNHSYLSKACNIEKTNCTQPYTTKGVTEFPITQFFDYPDHYRHLQLTACSFAEIKDVLLSNWTNGQYCCVIVMHSFEWIKRVKGTQTHVLDSVCLKRFEDVCQFLSENTDKFVTSSFSEEAQYDERKYNHPYIAKSNIFSTLTRYYEQFIRRRIK